MTNSLFQNCYCSTVKGKKLPGSPVLPDSKCILCHLKEELKKCQDFLQWPRLHNSSSWRRPRELQMELTVGTVGSQHASIGFGAAVVLHASAASVGCVVAMFNLTSTLEPLKTRSSFKSWIHPHLASEHGDHKAIGQEPTSLSTIYPHEWVNATCLYLYLILWMQLWWTVINHDQLWLILLQPCVYNTVLSCPIRQRKSVWTRLQLNAFATMFVQLLDHFVHDPIACCQFSPSRIICTSCVQAVWAVQNSDEIGLGQNVMILLIVSSSWFWMHKMSLCI